MTDPAGLEEEVEDRSVIPESLSFIDNLYKCTLV